MYVINIFYFISIEPKPSRSVEIEKKKNVFLLSRPFGIRRFLCFEGNIPITRPLESSAEQFRSRSDSGSGPITGRMNVLNRRSTDLGVSVYHHIEGCYLGSSSRPRRQQTPLGDHDTDQSLPEQLETFTNGWRCKQREKHVGVGRGWVRCSGGRSQRVFLAVTVAAGDRRSSSSDEQASGPR